LIAAKYKNGNNKTVKKQKELEVRGRARREAARRRKTEWKVNLGIVELEILLAAMAANGIASVHTESALTVGQYYTCT